MKTVFFVVIVAFAVLGCTRQTNTDGIDRKTDAIFILSDSQCIVQHKGSQTRYDDVRDIIIRDGEAYIWSQNKGIYKWDSIITDGTGLQNNWPYLTCIYQHTEGAEWAGTSIYMFNKNKTKHFRVGAEKDFINFEWYGYFDKYFVIENGMDSFSVIDTNGHLLKTYGWPEK
jgi:hypothetical protein